MTENEKTLLVQRLQKMSEKKRLREILKLIDKSKNIDDTIYLGDLYIAELKE